MSVYEISSHIERFKAKLEEYPIVPGGRSPMAFGTPYAPTLVIQALSELIERVEQLERDAIA